jgi:hypothetical protein
MSDPYYWADFVAQGDELFDYMRHNFESMFDGASRIKHFMLTFDVLSKGCDTDELYKEHGKDIEQELISWIRTEFDTGRLFDKEKWKPFYIYLPDMYLGYRHIFQYKHYVFQLALDYCFEYDWRIGMGDCKDCETSENSIHFQLVIYGVKDENDIVSGIRSSITLRDNSMPDCWWQIK